MPSLVITSCLDAITRHHSLQSHHHPRPPARRPRRRARAPQTSSGSSCSGAGPRARARAASSAPLPSTHATSPSRPTPSLRSPRPQVGHFTMPPPKSSNFTSQIPRAICPPAVDPAARAGGAGAPGAPRLHFFRETGSLGAPSITRSAAPACESLHKPPASHFTSASPPTRSARGLTRSAAPHPLVLSGHAASLTPY